MVDVKICGVTDRSAGQAAAAHGARYVGFVFFEKSPRNLRPEQAAAFAADLGGRCETVAVTVDADLELLQRLAETLAPDWIQLHGAETPAAAARAKPFARRGVIKALPVARAEDFAAAETFAPVADMLLFDAKAPAGATLPGGNGAAFDWRLMAGRRFARPWMLSGGLDAANVAEAVAASGARAVDVSSGVEAAPGLKDPAKIEAFLKAARALGPAKA